MKFACCPSSTPPTSASLTAASICIFARSFAMVNISGVLKLAATVCPASTFREITMPLIGAAMVVRSRSTLAESTDAWRILMLASAWWSATRFCWYSDSETSFAV